jgi:hypothetical protein
MLTAYVDESGIDQGGWMFLAGFVGDDSAWIKATHEWKEAIAPREHLHMKEMRLKERHRPLLARAGAVPNKCGLTPILGGVRFNDYADLIKGKRDERLMAGYVACCFAMMVNTLRGIPKHERLEVVFENQPVHGGNVSIAMDVIQNVSSEEMRLPDGTPKLANWRSVPKESTVLTEIADYYSYALFQQWKDKSSLKSSLCDPIMKSGDGEGLGAIMRRPTIRHIISNGQLLYAIEEAERIRQKMLGKTAKRVSI